MQREVVDYIAAIAPEQRALFDRVHRGILEACPQAEVVFSYKMPTYRVGKRRLNVAAWKHGVSIYGWKAHGDGGLTLRHPELQSSRGTIQLRTELADEISDEEIRALARAALAS
jgi:uncharacterized protein YdhG (YjbR/CyaY superfamily)